MCENMTGNKRETDLEIKDILLEFLRRWKVIILFAVVFGIAFGGMKYRKDYVAAHTPVQEVKNTTLEEAYADLDKDQYERVIMAVNLKASIDSKSLYMKESVLMNINAHAEDAVILQYQVEGEQAKEIVNSYMNYIDSGSIASELEKDGIQTEDKYLSELIEVLPNKTKDAMTNFTVKVMYSDAADAAALADAVKAQLEQYADRLYASGQAHSLSLVGMNQVQIVDEKLAEQQDEYVKETSEQQDQLASVKANMNANQLRVYLDMEKKIFAWGDTEEEENAEEAEETTDPMQPAGTVKVSVSKKQILMGAVVGAAVAIVYIFLAYLLSTKLRNKDEVENLYHTRVLGTVRKEKKGNLMETAVWKLENLGHKQLSYEEQIQMLISNIYIACRDTKTDCVYFTGSMQEKIEKELLAALSDGLKEKNIRTIMGGAVAYDAKELLCAAETGSVVVFEKRRESYYAEILSELQLCDDNHIQVLGMVVLEN